MGWITGFDFQQG